MSVDATATKFSFEFKTMTVDVGGHIDLEL
jgi:hypothetical protein